MARRLREAGRAAAPSGTAVVGGSGFALPRSKRVELPTSSCSAAAACAVAAAASASNVARLSTRAAPDGGGGGGGDGHGSSGGGSNSRLPDKEVQMVAAGVVAVVAACASYAYWQRTLPFCFAARLGLRRWEGRGFDLRVSC